LKKGPKKGEVAHSPAQKKTVAVPLLLLRLLGGFEFNFHIGIDSSHSRISKLITRIQYVHILDPGLMHEFEDLRDMETV
jgi:hypothetical protein